jgi:hypothetical protein
MIYLLEGVSWYILKVIFKTHSSHICFIFIVCLIFSFIIQLALFIMVTPVIVELDIMNVFDLVRLMWIPGTLQVANDIPSFDFVYS